jgi:hypothetical protein
VTFTDDESNNGSQEKKGSLYARRNKQNPSHKKWETHLPRRDDGKWREPRIPHRVAWNENAATVDGVGRWGKQWSDRERCREGGRRWGIKQASKASRGPFGLGFLAWRLENGEAAAAATLSAAPARMLWPARKGDHDPTAMSVLRACCGGKRKGKCKAIMVASTLGP